jgi:hypothetical protein
MFDLDILDRGGPTARPMGPLRVGSLRTVPRSLTLGARGGELGILRSSSSQDVGRRLEAVPLKGCSKMWRRMSARARLGPRWETWKGNDVVGELAKGARPLVAGPADQWVKCLRMRRRRWEELAGTIEPAFLRRHMDKERLPNQARRDLAAGRRGGLGLSPVLVGGRWSCSTCGMAIRSIKAVAAAKSVCGGRFSALGAGRCQGAPWARQGP